MRRLRVLPFVHSFCCRGECAFRPQYEAYQPMAEREIHAIIARARQRWELRHVAISHRIGVVPQAESSVEIAISSAHRREALQAVQFAIDELKASVPIWKKEVYAGGDGAKWKENAESTAPRIGDGAAGAGGSGAQQQQQQQQQQQLQRQRQPKDSVFGTVVAMAAVAAVGYAAGVASRRN
jgi:molybdopterin synthase catalytic subunit